MKKKWAIRPLELWNPGAVEQWLEEEAEQGWYLAGGYGLWLKLEQREPRVCRVRLHPQGPESREAFQDRVKAYEEAGWIFAEDIGSGDLEVFYCMDPEAPELFTDTGSYQWAWREQLERAWRNTWLLLSLPLMVLVVAFVVEKGSVLQMLLRAQTFELMCVLVLLPLLTVLLARQLRMLARLRRQMKAGVPAEESNDWRRARRWWRLAVILYVAYWALFCFRGLDGLLLRKTEVDLPRPYLGEIEETSDSEELELERYIERYTPMAPEGIETQFYVGENRVRNTADRLRFEGLAKALYREKRKDFLKDWPQAAEMPVENAAFDEAVLLTGGEDVQMFLARSGCVVYSLWVNFPTDLTGGIEAAAASMTGEVAR